MDGKSARDTVVEFSGVEELRMLLEISESLHRSLNIDELLPYIVSRAKDLLDAETVSILLHDPAKDEFFFRLTEGNPKEGASKLKEIRVPARKGIAGSVFESGRPEMVRNVCVDPRHYKEVDDKTRFETRSMVAVPLEVRGKVIGVMEACNKRQGDFGDKDLNILLSIASAVAMPLDNARVYTELKKEYEELRLVDRAKDDLIETAKSEKARLLREIEDRFRFDHIRGNSPQMLELFRLCDKVMGSDVTVLIEGETGTGKELIARCLHYNGPRKDKLFVTQNCGSIPEALLASELFGHRRGAFTGAVSDKKGLFEVAHGGTIFLDEVAEMSPAMQVSLLRVLQEGEIRPLGADQIRKVDVRVISATNRNLEDDVREGIFRQDLFYRLSVFTIKVPPLREREGDVRVLTEHFIRKFNRKLNKSVKGLSHNAQMSLDAYAFPGNVRELENEMERAVLLAENGKNIECAHLSERVLRKAPGVESGPGHEGKLKEMVQEMEKRVLVETLQECGGNKARAAKELGLSRFGLMKKIKRYGLQLVLFVATSQFSCQYLGLTN